MGEFGGITIFKEDITERVNSHRALVASDSRLRFALDASKAGTWSVDLRTGIVHWDERARALIGFGSENGTLLENVIAHFPRTIRLTAQALRVDSTRHPR